MLSQSMENYLKTVYELQQEADWVSTTALAERLSNAPASVTNMIKKLATSKLNLLEYKPYRGVRLTSVGEKVALEIIRHHRLIELYLAEVMGVPWDEVHAEAEKIEHVISEDLEERISAALGHPTLDPHGSPIPAKDGAMIDQQALPLSELADGQTALIAEVYDENADLLRYLGDMGFYPKESITLLSHEPFEGPLKIRFNDTNEVKTLGRKVAQKISVMVQD